MYHFVDSLKTGSCALLFIYQSEGEKNLKLVKTFRLHNVKRISYVNRFPAVHCPSYVPAVAKALSDHVHPSLPLQLYATDA